MRVVDLVYGLEAERRVAGWRVENPGTLHFPGCGNGTEAGGGAWPGGTPRTASRADLRRTTGAASQGEQVLIFGSLDEAREVMGKFAEYAALCRPSLKVERQGIGDEAFSATRTEAGRTLTAVAAREGIGVAIYWVEHPRGTAPPISLAEHLRDASVMTARLPAFH